MLDAKEVKEVTNKNRQNIKISEEAYIKDVVENFDKKYKKDIKKIERSILKASKKGLYGMNFVVSMIDHLEAKAYDKGITQYFQNLGYKIHTRFRESYTSIAGKQYVELTIGIEW